MKTDRKVYFRGSVTRNTHFRKIVRSSQNGPEGYFEEALHETQHSGNLRPRSNGPEGFRGSLARNTHFRKTFRSSENGPEVFLRKPYTKPNIPVHPPLGPYNIIRGDWKLEGPLFEQLRQDFNVVPGPRGLKGFPLIARGAREHIRGRLFVFEILGKLSSHLSRILLCLPALFERPRKWAPGLAETLCRCYRGRPGFINTRLCLLPGTAPESFPWQWWKRRKQMQGQPFEILP